MGFAPLGNSAAMMPRESALFSTSLAVPPSALKSLERVFWKGVGLRRAAGSQMRVGPEGFRTWTVVVTSKVRQESGASLLAKRRAGFGNAMAAERVLAVRRKSRRFIRPPVG